MKLAFAVLAHDNPDNLIRLVSRLTIEEDLAVVHWDRKSELDIVRNMTDNLPTECDSRVRFAKRHNVQWGDWSMVEATLACLEEIVASGETIDYVILLSGDDYPIRPLNHLKAFLSAGRGREYIEAVDPNETKWVVDGYNAERLIYRFYVNWRRHPRLFGWAISLQQLLGARRSMPDGLEPRLGSQWWALTWETAREILLRSKSSRIRRFFRRTWVPDENFFQTMAADIVPAEKIAQCGLTFYHFSTDGKPLVYYDDHAELLAARPCFFARKLSPHAHALRDTLDEVCAARASEPAPQLDLAKNLAPYDQLVHLHHRAPPNRRIVACDHNVNLGDLDWNRIPYFFLVDFGHSDLTEVRKVLNASGRIRCFGELFDPEQIDYDLPGEEHPGYPSRAVALRDHCGTTFLYDLLHLKPREEIVGFVESPKRADGTFAATLHDPRALPVFLVPRPLFRKSPNQNLDLGVFYQQRRLQDCLDMAGYPGWRAPMVCLYEDGLTAGDIDKIKVAILAWREGRAR